MSELCDSERTPSADQTAKVEALTEKARILATKGKYREALDLTDQVLSIKPDFADVYLYRGTIYGLTRDLETAIEEIRKGEAILERQGDSQRSEIMRQLANDLQSRIDSGTWAEELEEERRIAEEEQ